MVLTEFRLIEFSEPVHPEPKNNIPYRWCKINTRKPIHRAYSKNTFWQWMKFPLSYCSMTFLKERKRKY